MIQGLQTISQWRAIDECFKISFSTLAGGLKEPWQRKKKGRDGCEDLLAVERAENEICWTAAFRRRDALIQIFKKRRETPKKDARKGGLGC